MYLELLRQFRTTFTNDQVSLFYHGIFDDDFTDKFISILAFDSERRVKGKMAFVMAESFQNIIRHRDEEIDDDNSNSFGIRGTKDWMHIFSSNLVDENAKRALESSLLNINSLSPEDLKAAYLGILKKGELSEKGGAGLGLIEMSRRSNNPLQFEFHPQDQGIYAFNMQIDFQRSLEDPEEQIIAIRENSEINDIILDEEILFVYNGEFSDDVLQPMIPIVETNTSIEGNVGYSIFHIAVELMQNIGRHGVENENGKRTGLFILKKEADGYYLCSGNYTKSSTKDLEDYVLDLNSRDLDYLNDLYKKALKESIIKDENSARVGLIDIRRTANNPIDIEVSVDNEGTFVMIGAKISVE